MTIRMIDISEKKLTRRVAVASVKIIASRSLIKKMRNGQLPKGDCLSAGSVAGILAAKNTAALLPLCHSLPVPHVDMDFKFSSTTLTIVSTVQAHYATGGDMEALTACAVAALTVYDMAKTEEQNIVITDLKLLSKSGGKSGDYSAR